MPAAAKVVLTGGWAWVTPPMAGFSRYRRRCIRISEEGLLVPSKTLPFRSSLTSMSSVINPLETPVGVAQRVSSETLQLMLPSLAATKFFWYIRRPYSRISALAWASVG